MMPHNPDVAERTYLVGNLYLTLRYFQDARDSFLVMYTGLFVWLPCCCRTVTYISFRDCRCWHF